MLTHDHTRAPERLSPAISAVRVTITSGAGEACPVSIFRYLLVGACNTIFGYGCFVLFTVLLDPVFSYGYVFASLLSNLFSITFAFLGYKWLVFKTRGNYLKEW